MTLITKYFVNAIALTLIGLIGFIGSVAIVAIYPHENKPPRFQDAGWPSCHWDGTPDKNDWQVSFQIDGTKPNQIVWKQWVATGISEKAAENLCDAYVRSVHD